MADCGPNCDCANCCITPESYTDAEFGRKTGSPGIVLATPESFPVPGATGNYFEDVSVTEPTNPIEKYTSDELTSVLNAINNYVLPLLDSSLSAGVTSLSAGPLIAAGTYPDLETKISISPINTVEVANFIEDSFLTPTIAVATAETNPQSILEQLDTFYSTSVSGIALCSFLQEPFGILSLAEDLLNTVVGILDSAKALIDGVVTTAQSIIGDIKNFVEEAKKVVDRIIDSVRQKLDNVVKQFNEKFEQLKQDGLKLGQHFKATAQKLSDMVNDVKTFFSDFNANTLKAKIEEAIVNSANSFGQLTVDIVNHLLFVFCSITTDIENQLNAPVDEVQNFVTRFEENFKLLTIVSNGVTNAAVVTGRPTPTPESLAAECERYASEVNASYSGGNSPSIVHIPEYTNLPDPSEWSNLTFTDKVINNSVLAGPTRVYMYDYRNYAEGIDNQGRPYIDLPHPAYPSNHGYIGTLLETFDRANQVARELGVRFLITSAYRSPVYNQHVRNTQGGGAVVNSLHTKGIALDISKSSIGNVARCTAAMRAIGFGGVGTYNSFMHYDLRGSSVMDDLLERGLITQNEYNRYGSSASWGG